MTIRSTPFSRAKSIAQQVMEILIGTAGDPGAQEAALSYVPQYRSRGHGEGLDHNKRSRRCVAQDKRDAIKARNRARARR